MSDSRIQIGDDVIFHSVHDEVVILNLKTQQYYGLDDVGATMWRLLIEHGDASVVTEFLHATYEADKETLRRDLESLKRNLVAAGLLKCSD